MRNLMSETHVATILRISPRTLRNWRSQHRGPAYLKIEGAVRYDPAAVEEFVKAAALRQQRREPLTQKREAQG